ncbi:flagellar hook capping FlgD N-terminal domain-containing protein [Paenibacillus yanchengensis]|uniref:Flagellar hook capping FlgD N-terminal domain-containing protein n=1 Tax=Paenibacillus yanchengensis TaxID=2035833 RepID=A0ABW4YMA7_9BACL
MPNSVFTRNVWPNYHSDNIYKASKREAGDALGKDQFMKILVAQLRNQDPMQPMQDKEFIAQMAQFTSVEQLMNITGELTLLRQNIGTASNLIGKEVQWNEYDDKGEVITKNGIVNSIVLKEGLLFAKIGESEVAIDYLISISEPKSEEVSPTPIDPPGNEEGEEAGDVNE